MHVLWCEYLNHKILSLLEGSGKWYGIWLLTLPSESHSVRILSGS